MDKELKSAILQLINVAENYLKNATDVSSSTNPVDETPDEQEECPTTLGDLQGICADMIKAGKKTKVLAALKHFGVPKLGELSADDYDDFFGMLANEK